MAGAPLRALIEKRARHLGFDVFGIADASARPDLPEKLNGVLENNWHAGMDWMFETRKRRASPADLWPGVRSVIVLAMSYAPGHDPLPDLARRDRGNISVYARNRDYHSLIKGRLKEVAGLLASRGNCQVKVFVDTAPVMEKPLAESAGIGWQGKNTVLTSRRHGAWLFLGEIYCSIPLPPDAEHARHCGSCTACLDICPTSAFPAPYRLDARKCLAYYNNEHHGPIPRAFRRPMGNRIFGCDDCLAVCPWNKFARKARQSRFHARDELTLPPLSHLLDMDDARFRSTFSGSPVRRLGHARFLRNTLICAANSDDPGLLPHVIPLLDHPDPVVRGSAVWALASLAPPETFEHLRQRHKLLESDRGVILEWAGESP